MLISIFFEEGLQTVTLTIVPRQLLSNPDFIFHLIGGEYGYTADAVITSLEPGQQTGPAGEHITITSDRKNIGVGNLSLTINEPYNFTMTLQVDMYSPYIEYKPYLSFDWLPGEASCGTTQGSEFSFSVDALGIWTWATVGEYQWEWCGPGTQYAVSFN